MTPLSAVRKFERAVSRSNPWSAYLRQIKDASSKAAAFKRAGKYRDAEPHARKADGDLSMLLGTEHPMTLDAKHELGAILAAQGRLIEAEPLAQDVLRSLRPSPRNPEHPLRTLDIPPRTSQAHPEHP